MKAQRSRYNTSSNLQQIIVKALCMLSVVPVMVTIRSGHEPSDMLILAPLCQQQKQQIKQQIKQ